MNVVVVVVVTLSKSPYPHYSSIPSCKNENLASVSVEEAVTSSPIDSADLGREYIGSTLGANTPPEAFSMFL